MVQLDPVLRLVRLPSSSELPDSDETPVDSELQDTVPGLLKDILCLIWQNRFDWFMGVDMGIYADTETPHRAIVPDGFLSIGVPRFRDRDGDLGRPSYVLWEENGLMPIMVLEVVSETYRGEYETKLREYRDLDILYYVVYNPEEDPPDHARLEVYKLVGGEYVLLLGEPVWMPEIGLGIGRAMGWHRAWQREWLYWFDEEGERYPIPEEFQRYRADLAEAAEERERERANQEQARAGQEQARADQERERAEAEQQARLQTEQEAYQARLQAQQARLEAERLARRLRELGIDPGA